MKNSNKESKNKEILPKAKKIEAISCNKILKYGHENKEKHNTRHIRI